jgi:hypothetical protein
MVCGQEQLRQHDQAGTTVRRLADEARGQLGVARDVTGRRLGLHRSHDKDGRRVLVAHFATLTDRLAASNNDQMPETPSAFFLTGTDKEHFIATVHTAGPWSPTLQHAGPPSALVVRALENLPSSVDGPAEFGRVTIEILGPVPVGEVTVTATIARPGRAVELLEGTLEAQGRVAMRARAWRIRTAAQSYPQVDNSARLPGFAALDEPVPPIPQAPTAFAQGRWHEGYLRAVDWRFVTGHIETVGPAVVWASPKVSVVDDEASTALQRLFVLADSGNGLSRLLDVDAWWFINTELTVHLVRPPAGDWTLIAARSSLAGTGIGLAETELFDQCGRFGRGAQSLMVGPR